MNNKKIILTSMLALAACGSKSTEMASQSGVSQESLTLMLSGDDQRIFVQLINNELSPVLVNRLFRVRGSDAEVTFEFEDAARAKRSYGGRGQSHIPNPSDSFLSLMPRATVGVYYLNVDIRDMYSIGVGCFKVKALYQNKIPNTVAYNELLASNEVTICFDEE